MGGWNTPDRPELIYDKLFNAFGLWQERPHELSGLRARLAARVALHNFCMWLNEQLGRVPGWLSPICWGGDLNSHQAFKQFHKTTRCFCSARSPSKNGP